MFSLYTFLEFVIVFVNIFLYFMYSCSLNGLFKLFLLRFSIKYIYTTNGILSKSFRVQKPTDKSLYFRYLLINFRIFFNSFVYF